MLSPFAPMGRVVGRCGDGLAVGDLSGLPLSQGPVAIEPFPWRNVSWCRLFWHCGHVWRKLLVTFWRRPVVWEFEWSPGGSFIFDSVISDISIEIWCAILPINDMWMTLISTVSSEDYEWARISKCQKKAYPWEPPLWRGLILKRLFRPMTCNGIGRRQRLFWVRQNGGSYDCFEIVLCISFDGMCSSLAFSRIFPLRSWMSWSAHSVTSNLLFFKSFPSMRQRGWRCGCRDSEKRELRHQIDVLEVVDKDIPL
jgi:hypothetical protein